MTLEPVPEDWERCLAVVAHPDDLEYGAAAALARWTTRGRRPSRCSPRAGEAGIATMEPSETARVRTAEQEASGADRRRRASSSSSGHRDGMLTSASTSVATSPEPSGATGPTSSSPSRSARGSTAAARRRTTPTTGCSAKRSSTRSATPATAGCSRSWSTRATSRGTSTRFVLAASSPRSSHYVDISDTIDVGMASLRAHQAYFDALGGVDGTEALPPRRRRPGGRGGRRGPRPARRACSRFPPWRSSSTASGADPTRTWTRSASPCSNGWRRCCSISACPGCGSASRSRPAKPTGWAPTPTAACWWRRCRCGSTATTTAAPTRLPSPSADAQAFGWIVAESEARSYGEHRTWPDGERSPGLSITTFFDKKPDVDDETFYRIWHGEHTPLSFEIHPFWLYVRNQVLRSITPGAPSVRGIVYEAVPTDEQMLDFTQFFGCPAIPIG